MSRPPCAPPPDHSRTRWARYNMDKRISDSEFASRMVNVSTPVLKILPDVFHKKVDVFNS